MLQRTEYRNDVDGLRAVAVLLVILFHLGVTPVSGGFVGVDIFYIISGFVIFRVMILERESGKFSILSFYRRRVRRIFPALAVSVLFALVVGSMILTPGEYESLSYSALAAVFSVSNIYFNDRQGYFADATNSSPLIHTWSLGVEEQFYLVAPFILLIFASRFGSRGLFRGLLVLCALSFTYNLYAVYGLNNEKHAFYLPMSRFWEIGFGGIVAFMEPRISPGRIVSALLAIAGLIGIAVSALFIDSTMPFPAFVALLPVVATGLVILAAPNSVCNRALASPAMTFFGKISYSLYLFHWPVIVYFGLYIGRDSTGPEKVGLFLVTTFLAFLNWKFVETPFRTARDGGNWRVAKRAMAGGLVSVLVFCAVVAVTEGIPYRLRAEAIETTRRIEQTMADTVQCATVDRRNVVSKVRICGHDGASVDYLVLGDSHAGMLGGALSQHLHGTGLNGLVAVMQGCSPLIGVYYSARKNRAECMALAVHIEKMVQNENVPIVILANRWANLASNERAPGDGFLSQQIFDAENGSVLTTLDNALTRTVKRLTAAGAYVVVVGPVPEVDFNVPNMMVRAVNLDRPLLETPRTAFNTRQEIVLHTLKRLESMPNVSVVYPHEQLCNSERCRLVDDGRPLYKDDDHLTLAGVRLILDPVLRAVEVGGKLSRR